VLLTWATGGTPAGEAPAQPGSASSASTWPMGVPDAVIDLPAFTLAADEQGHDVEVPIAGVNRDRWLRGIDILPGTPAIVRGASVEVDTPASPGRMADERLLALWVPGRW